MILEVAILNVRPGQAEAFEAAFKQAAPLIAATPGYISHELQKCLDLNVARLRPSEDGLKLILSNRQSPHGDALIYDPETGEFSEAKFDHLKRYGILNPYQNDIYYTSSSGGIQVERDGESETVRSDKRYLSVPYP